MGLFWKRDLVRWRGNRGVGPSRLAGQRQTAKKRGEVDFWEQSGIYALYADYRLIYVGQAGLSDRSFLGNRLKRHLTDESAGRWDIFSWFGLQKVKGNNELGMRSEVKISSRADLANVLEGILIEVAEPPMNSQKGRFGRRVERYIQVDDSTDANEVLMGHIDRAFDNLDKKIEKTKKALDKAIKRAQVEG